MFSSSITYTLKILGHEKDVDAAESELNNDNEAVNGVFGDAVAAMEGDWSTAESGLRSFAVIHSRGVQIEPEEQEHSAEIHELTAEKNQNSEHRPGLDSVTRFL